MSKGNAPKERAKLLVKALLEYEINQGDRITNLGVNWAGDGSANLQVSATKQALFNLLKGIPEFKPTLTTKDDQVRKTIGESLTKHLNQFLGILQDHRTKHQMAAGDWTFTLKLWHRVELKNAEEDIPRNLQEFDRLWESKRSPQSAAQVATTNIPEGRPESSGEVVAAGVRENARLRGFNDVRSVTVWEGREVLLGSLGQKLRDGLKVLAITGQGGIGKSSLATKLMEALGVNFQPQGLRGDCGYFGVVYFRVQLGMSFDDGAGQLLRYLGEEQDLVKPQEKIDKIITYLAGQKWLLVLDNLEDILHPASHEAAGRAVSAEWGQLLNGLVYKNHRSQVIITSREMPVDLGELRGKEYRFNRRLVKTEALEGIDDKAAVKVLAEDYEMQDSEADLAWMVDKVKGHPLVLELLGNYADQPGYLRQHPELITGEAKPVLQDQLARLDEAGRDLLKRMCVLRVPIDVQGLTFLRLYEDDEDNYGRFWLAAEIEEPAELTAAEVAETREMVEKLVASSLVRRSYNAQKQEQVYDLHRVIADFLQEEYAEESPELLKRVYRFYCTGKGVENPKTLADLQPILEAQHFAFQLGSYDEVYKLLKWDIRESLYTWGHWTLLKELYEKILPYLADTNDRSHALRQIGCIHRELGNWSEAERVFNDALALSEEEESKSGKATALGMLGDIARNRGNWDEAERLYLQSLELRTELGDRSGMASIWGVLGDIAKKRGNWDEAERIYNQSLELRIELGDRSGMASIWGVLGDIANNQGNWDEAERLYKQSLELMTELGDRSGMASSWELLGSIAYLRSNWDETERLYKQSLAVRTELGDRSGIASIWVVLGYLAQCRGNWDETERLYNQSLALRTELGDRSGMASIWVVLGYLAQCRGNWDEAERLYIQSLAVKTELGDRPGMASNWGFLGDIARNKMNIDEAINLHQQCLEIMQELGDQRGIAVTNCDLGEEELARDNLDAAEKFLTLALMQLEAIGHTQYIGTANYDLAQLHRKRGNLDLAQQHYTTATTIFQNLGAAKDLERIQQEWSIPPSPP